MAAAAILNYNFVMLDQPWSPFVHLKFTFKFRVDRVRTFWDEILQIWLRMPIHAPPKIMFLGSFDCQTLFFIIETPQRPYPTWKHALWDINGRDQSSGVTCRREQEYKKGWNTKSNGKFPPYADPLSVVPHQPNFACGVLSRISFLVLSFIKIGWKCGSSGGSKFWPSHWLGTSLIQRLVAIAQAVIT